MKTSAVAAIAFLAGLLSGCASETLVLTKAEIASGKVCCSSFSEFKFKEIKSGERLVSQIDQSSQLFEFSDGRSFAVGVALGYSDHPRRLFLKSFLSGTWLPSATIFYPKIQTLGVDRKPTRAPLSLTLSQVDDFFKGGYYGAIVQLNPDDRFVVFYSDSEAAGKWLQYYRKPPGLVTIPGAGATYTISSAPGGRLELELEE